MSQVRISRTDDVDAVLSYLRGQYPLLSEADIIKMALSEKYQQAVRETMDEDMRRSEQKRLEQMLLEGVRSERGMEVGSREWGRNTANVSGPKRQEEASTLLAATPEIGSPRYFSHPELQGVRFLPLRRFENYLLFYRALKDEEVVEIVRIVHGARNLPGLFAGKRS